MMTDDRELAELREALVRGLRVDLPQVDPGSAAFERHQLLAIRFHRAARLNDPDEPEQERQGWLTYFREHFPRGDQHAQRLWEFWRGRLVKDEFPGKKVLVSHGQPHAHWKIDRNGRLFIDLESMWTDFEQSVDSFIAVLESDPQRRRRALAKFRRRLWTVEQIEFEESEVKGVLTTASSSFLSATISATASSFPLPPKPD